MKSLSPNIRQQLAAVVEKRAAARLLVIAPEEFLGEHMIMMTPEGRKLLFIDTAPGYWRDVEIDEGAIMRTAVEMVDSIADRKGEGMVWTLGGLPLVHLVEDDGRIIIGRDADTVRLRTLHAHERDAIAEREA